jgi:predicted TIM-barrel fold metal-dependent hydrolase
MPKISAHEHFRVGGNIEEYFKAAKLLNIEKAIFLPTDWPPANPKYKENMNELLKIAKLHPEKIIPFATSYSCDPQAPEIIESALKNGAKGIKFIDWLYSPKTKVCPLNSENMYKVYEIARKYKVPVLLHIDFQKKPEWKYQFETVALDFPEVTFILAHYCRSASLKNPQLELCAETLDKFPNVYIDISMGGGLKRYMRYFDENTELWRNFILKYQDRIFWGTDMILDNEDFKNAQWIYKRILADLLILSQEKYQSPFYQEDKTFHKGLNLPKDVLKKILYLNPKKILNI